MNYVFINAKFPDPAFREMKAGKALLITNNTIKHIGQLSECIALSPKTPEIIDLRGKVLLPAFNDAHTHFVEYAKRKIMVNLEGKRSSEEIMTALESFRSQLGSLTGWVQGGGWDVNIISDPEQIDIRLLDKVFPDVPVSLFSKDYHARWCNSLALKAAGVTPESPDPQGGRYSRDSSGRVNGIAYEAAAEHIDRFVVQPDKQTLKRAVHEAIREAQRMGLAGVNTMEGDYSWSILEDARREGANFRFTWHFPLDKLDDMVNRHVQSYMGDEKLKIGGVKVFADGALGSQTAAMFAPYTGTANNGILRYTDYELSEIGQFAASHGIALTVHAIGNRTVHQVLRLFHNLNDTYQGLMHRIEHVQAIRKSDLDLLHRSGAFCSVQPVHLANDIPMIESHWRDVRDQAYRFKDIATHCNGLGFGSDAPIESINPCLGIYTLLQRKPGLDPDAPTWEPGQTLSVTEAIKGYTYGAAKASDSEKLRGTIESKSYADLCVWEDFTAEPDEYWLSAKPQMLMIDGEMIYNDLN